MAKRNTFDGGFVKLTQVNKYIAFDNNVLWFYVMTGQVTLVTEDLILNHLMLNLIAL